MTAITNNPVSSYFAKRKAFPELAKRNDDLTSRCTFETLMPAVAYVVEAANFEHFSLWKNHNEKRLWCTVPTGLGCQVGTVGDMPVVVQLRFDAIDGHLVLFYEATSQVVDHRMVEKWLRENVPVLAKATGRRLECDAMNFHHCLHYLDELNRVNEAASLVAA